MGRPQDRTASPMPHAQCPMTAGAPLGETPRPHCLPHARSLLIAK
ncbi:hypothetical protein [Tolypothrix sp. VBCCA 56010]